MNKSILVLEENSVIHGLVASALDLEGLTLHHEFNPGRYVQRATSLMPDLILLGNSGQGGAPEQVRELRAVGALQRVPVVLLTGARDHMDADAAASLRVDGVVQKPFEASDLQQQVSKHLNLVELVGSAYEFAQSQSTREEGPNPLASLDVLDSEVLGLLHGEPAGAEQAPGVVDEDELDAALHPERAFEMVGTRPGEPAGGAPATDGQAGPEPLHEADFGTGGFGGAATPDDEAYEELGEADLLDEESEADAHLAPQGLDESFQPGTGAQSGEDRSGDLDEIDVDLPGADEAAFGARGEAEMDLFEADFADEEGPAGGAASEWEEGGADETLTEGVPLALSRMMELKPVFSLSAEEKEHLRAGADAGPEPMSFTTEDEEDIAASLGGDLSDLDEIDLAPSEALDGDEGGAPAWAEAEDDGWPAEGAEPAWAEAADEGEPAWSAGTDEGEPPWAAEAPAEPAGAAEAAAGPAPAPHRTAEDEEADALFREEYLGDQEIDEEEILAAAEAEPPQEAEPLDEASEAELEALVHDEERLRDLEALDADPPPEPIPAAGERQADDELAPDDELADLPDLDSLDTAPPDEAAPGSHEEEPPAALDDDEEAMLRSSLAAEQEQERRVADVATAEGAGEGVVERAFMSYDEEEADALEDAWLEVPGSMEDEAAPEGLEEIGAEALEEAPADAPAADATSVDDLSADDLDLPEGFEDETPAPEPPPEPWQPDVTASDEPAPFEAEQPAGGRPAAEPSPFETGEPVELPPMGEPSPFGSAAFAAEPAETGGADEAAALRDTGEAITIEFGEEGEDEDDLFGLAGEPSAVEHEPPREEEAAGWGAPPPSGFVPKPSEEFPEDAVKEPPLGPAGTPAEEAPVEPRHKPDEVLEDPDKLTAATELGGPAGETLDTLIGEDEAQTERFLDEAASELTEPKPEEEPPVLSEAFSAAGLEEEPPAAAAGADAPLQPPEAWEGMETGAEDEALFGEDETLAPDWQTLEVDAGEDALGLEEAFDGQAPAGGDEPAWTSAAARSDEAFGSGDELAWDVTGSDLPEPPTDWQDAPADTAGPFGDDLSGGAGGAWAAAMAGTAAAEAAAAEASAEAAAAEAGSDADDLSFDDAFASLRAEIAANPEGERLEDVMRLETLRDRVERLEFSLPAHESTFARGMGFYAAPGVQEEPPVPPPALRADADIGTPEQHEGAGGAAETAAPVATPPSEPAEPAEPPPASPAAGEEESVMSLLEPDIRQKLGEVLDEIISISVRRAVQEEMPRLMERLQKQDREA